MAGPIGENLVEILQGIRKSKQIYNTYYDPYDRSPDRVRALVGTSKDLHDVLQESEDLLRLWNRPYPGQTSLNRRLQESLTFIRRFCDVEEVPADESTGSPPSRKLTWKPFKYGWEDKRAKQLHEGLMIEIQKFIQFVLVVALRANVAPRGSAPSNTISGRLVPQSSTIEDIARRLNEIRYQVERRQNQAVLIGRDLDLTDLENRVEREWRLLCLRAGFEDHAHRPPLPSSSHNLLVSSAQVYQDLIIRHSRDTMISPRTEGLSIAPISTPQLLATRPPKRELPLSPDPNTALTISPNLEPDQHHVLLGDPALPICIAEFEMRPRQVLKLQMWRFEPHRDGRKLIWTGTKSANILEHYLPSSDILPYTYHSSLQTSSKSRLLTIPGPSPIRWLKNGTQKLADTRTDVTYAFVEPADSKRFQEELRDRHLIDTFDADCFRSQHSKTRFEAVNQDLKVWCSRDGDLTYTLSFFANHLQEHLEFPLDWFGADIAVSASKRTIQLEFLARAGSSSSGVGVAHSRAPSFLRKVAGSSRRVSSESSSAASAQVWAAVGSSASSTRGSINTVSTGSSTGSLGPSQGRIEAMARWADKFQYLSTQFSREEQQGSSSRVAAGSDHDGFTRFETLITNLMSQRKSNTPWTIQEYLAGGSSSR